MSTIRRSLDGDKAVEMDVIEAKADADTAPATPIPPAVAHEHRLQRTSRVPSPRPLGILPRLLADARPSTASSTTRSPPPTLSLPAAPSQTALSLAATSLHPSRTSLAHPSADADADHPPPASFHTLPPELHLAIARRLDFPTALRWRLACRYFCALLPADALPRKRRAYVVALHRHAARMAQNPPAEPPSRRSRLLAKRRHRNVPAAATGVQLPCHQCLRLKSVPDFESHTWGLDPGLPPVLPPAAATVTAIVDPWAAAAGLVDGSDSTTSASSTSSSGGGGGGGGGGYDDDWAAEEGRVPYRVCVQCKLRKGLFARGARFDWRGRERVLCRRCRRPGARMARHGVRWALMREMCRGCGTRAEWRWMAPVAVGEALLAGLVSALVAWGARCAAEAGGSLELGSPFRCIVFTVSARGTALG